MEYKNRISLKPLLCIPYFFHLDNRLLALDISSVLDRYSKFHDALISRGRREVEFYKVLSVIRHFVQNIWAKEGWSDGRVGKAA
jgi:hypothetical protein